MTDEEYQKIMAELDGRERFGRNPHVGQPFELRDYGL